MQSKRKPRNPRCRGVTRPRSTRQHIRGCSESWMRPGKICAGCTLQTRSLPRRTRFSSGRITQASQQAFLRTPSGTIIAPIQVSGKPRTGQSAREGIYAGRCSRNSQAWVSASLRMVHSASERCCQYEDPAVSVALASMALSGDGAHSSGISCLWIEHRRTAESCIRPATGPRRSGCHPKSGAGAVPGSAVGQDRVAGRDQRERSGPVSAELIVKR